MQTKDRRFRWWLLAAVLFATIFTALYWDAIVIRVAPKAVLTPALNELISQLEARFQDDPLLLLLRAADSEGNYTADVDLQVKNAFVGPVSYDMTLQTDGKKHRFFAEGTASTSERDADLSVYLDSEFMAISSEDLVQGVYYGVTYDTFAEDVRGIPLFDWVVSEGTLSQWQNSIASIQNQVSHTNIAVQIPDISQEKIQTLLLGIAAAPCQTEDRSVLLDDRPVTCRVLTYSFSGYQVRQVLPELMNTQYKNDKDITASFYLYQNAVVQISLSCTDEKNTSCYTFYPGLNPKTDRITLQYSDVNAEKAVTVSVITQNKENCYTEAWEIQKVENRLQEQIRFSFDWFPTNGELQLYAENFAEPISVNLTETEEGLQIVTEDLVRLLQSIQNLPAQGNNEQEKISCSMVIKKGASIQTPSYKNISQWSMDDLFLLLGSVGSLIGIDLGI